jgi:hypothetical protein
MVVNMHIHPLKRIATKVLDEEQVFLPLGKESHESYNLKHFLLQRHSRGALSAWIKKSIKDILYS